MFSHPHLTQIGAQSPSVNPSKQKLVSTSNTILSPRNNNKYPKSEEKHMRFVGIKSPLKTQSRKIKENKIKIPAKGGVSKISFKNDPEAKKSRLQINANKNERDSKHNSKLNAEKSVKQLLKQASYCIRKEDINYRLLQHSCLKGLSLTNHQTACELSIFPRKFSLPHKLVPSDFNPKNKQELSFKFLEYLRQKRIFRDQDLDVLYDQCVQAWPNEQITVREVLVEVVASLDE